MAVYDGSGSEAGDGRPIALDDQSSPYHYHKEKSADVEGPTTKRGLKSRQIQMIAIGGTVGTGLFVGIGQALATSGPAFTLMAYCIISILLYGIVTATTEMATYLPVPGCSMAYFGNRFGSRSLGFAMGYLYWYAFGILEAYEITAASLVINYWPNGVNVAVWITIMLVIIVALNFFPVKVYGETEFWFASIKVFTILGLLILSIVLFFGGGPTHHALYFHYWNDPGATKEYLVGGAAGRFCAALYVTVFSVFSFNFAPELLVITGGEMQNPRRNLPRAAKRYFYRLLLFYVGGALAIGVICSSNEPGLTDGSNGAAASPWAIAIKNASIHGLDSVVNAVIITSAWSSGNSYLYMSSRSLYSLAVAGNAPKIFAKVNGWGVPYVAVSVSALYAVLAYLNCGENSSKVFNYFVSLNNAAAFLSWICCCIVFLRFRKACKAQSVQDLPYQSRVQPYMAYVSMGMFTLLLLCNGFSVFFSGHWSTSTFVTSYIGLPAFLAIYFVHRLYSWREPWLHHPLSVDLFSGLDAVKALEAPPKQKSRQRKWFQKADVFFE